MNTFSKKFVSVALSVTTASFMLVPVAHGQQTVAELQALINSLLAQITNLQAQLVGLQGGAPTTGGVACSFTRDLTVGATGDDVKCLQQFLNANGYTVAASGAGSAGNESSYFGSLTQAAVAKYQAAKNITPPAGYFGPKTRSYVNSLAAFTPPGVILPGFVPSGFSLSLAPGNPLGAALPKGASGVMFLKFNVLGSGTLDSLTFKRVGIGATGDFNSAGIYLYEGNKRLTTGKSLNSTTHEVSFPNLNLSVSGTRTLSLVAEVSGSATTGNRSSFQLVSASGNPNPTGALIGSEFEIAGQAVGGITVTKSGSLPNPKIGEQDAQLSEFKVAVDSTEDMWLQRVGLTEGGNIQNNQLSNFILKRAGETVAHGDMIGDRDLIVLVFDQPFLIEKGQEKIFTLHGNVGGSTRADDTIQFYVDNRSDVQAIGKTFGYPASGTISAFDAASEGHQLTVQGGDVTITFNGPIAGDIPLRGQDVTVFDLTIASLNNIEIRNLRLNATTTLLGANEAFNDFKLWDTAKNAVISSATDVTTSTAVTVTDIININAGESKRMHVTVDVDSDNDANDTILVSLKTFESNDIRNLDNNTFVATSTIVPNAIVAGNTQTVQTPGLTLQLSASPGSQDVVKGTSNTSLAGFSFRASEDDIKITTIKLSASTTGATSSIDTVKSDLQNVALYDGTTRISDYKSFTGTALPGTATFTNLNLVIPKGQTKILVAKANLSTAATVNGVHFVYIASTGTTDITALDSDGNTATVSGLTANSGATVTVTTLNVGDVTVAKAVDNLESEPGIVIAGTQTTLARFRFTSANEGMRVDKVKFLVVDSATANATSTGAADEVPTIKLYDGATQIGAAGGYSVIASGNDAGGVIVEDLGWQLGKNEERTLTVKGVIDTININSANQADSGASIYVHVATTTGFEAVGASAKDTNPSATAVTGNQKVVYRTKPTVTWQALPTTNLTANPVVARFRVAAGPEAPISFNTISFKVVMDDATMSAVTGGTSGNFQVFNLTQDPSTGLNLATVVSGAASTTTGAAAITGGNSGFVTGVFNTEEQIEAGSFEDYEVKLTFVNISATAGAANVTVNLSFPEETAVGGSTFTTVCGACNDSTPGFIWSDNSKISHATTTADWANGRFTKLPSSQSWTLGN